MGLNKVRAFNPEPTAWIAIANTSLRVLEARPTALSANAGTISQKAGKVLLGLQEGAIELLEVQPAGRLPMDALDWWRGLKVEELNF